MVKAVVKSQDLKEKLLKKKKRVLLRARVKRRNRKEMLKRMKKKIWKDLTSLSLSCQVRNFQALLM